MENEDNLLLLDPEGHGADAECDLTAQEEVLALTECLLLLLAHTDPAGAVVEEAGDGQFPSRHTKG